MNQTRKVLTVLATAVALALMLVWDLNLPPGVIHGIPYVVLISVSYWLPWRAAPMVLAAVGTVLVVAGSAAPQRLCATRARPSSAIRGLRSPPKPLPRGRTAAVLAATAAQNGIGSADPRKRQNC